MRNRAVGLGQGAEFFRKKHNRSIQRDKKIKKIKLKSIHTLVIVLMLCGIGFGAYQGTLFLMSWEQLRINAFHLTNAQQLDQVELEGILKKYNVNIFSIEF